MRPHGVRHLLEVFLDIQTGAKDPSQVGEGGQPATAAPFAMEEHDVLDERGDQIRNLAQGREVILAIQPRRIAGGGERPDDAPPASHGHRQPRAKSHLANPRRPAPRGGKAGIRLDVVDQHGLSGQDSAQDLLLGRVVARRIEIDGVVSRVDQRAAAGILGEDGDPPALFDVGDHEPIVRHHPGHWRGELRQEALRIEGLLHGVPDRGQRGHEIRESNVHSVSRVRGRRDR